MLDKLLGTGEEPEKHAAPRGSSVREEDLELEPDFGDLSLKELAEAEAEESDSTSKSTPRTQVAGGCEFIRVDLRSDD